ncbi:MAG: gamma-glutamylcyclotransferase [Halioglobus sp.]|nr:gamma-glutamylcyclotransferase [Halioglobus sp.]
MSEQLHYFAYGSNMSLARLRARTPSARRLGLYRLAGHELRFHKHGADGSGKCDAFFTGATDQRIYGALYTLDTREKPALDAVEGLGLGYAEKQVQVEDHAGETLQAFTYYAIRTDPALLPFDWYLGHVRVGAREIGVPAAYLAAIEAVRSRPDPDNARDARERAVHAQRVLS